MGKDDEFDLASPENQKKLFDMLLDLSRASLLGSKKEQEPTQDKINGFQHPPKKAKAVPTPSQEPKKRTRKKGEPGPYEKSIFGALDSKGPMTLRQLGDHLGLQRTQGLSASVRTLLRNRQVKAETNEAGEKIYRLVK